MCILKIQIGISVMLLRKYYSKPGLCNVTLLIITALYNSCVIARIVSHDPRFDGKEHFIARMTLSTDKKLTFPMVRKQIPI